MVRPLSNRDAKYVTRPLNTVLGAPSHIAILRVLKDTASGATGREIARAAGIAPQATVDGLRRLERTGIVRRLAAGRAYVFRLQREHHLVRRGLLPLFLSEARFRPRLLEQLRKAFDGRVIAAAIFGSTGRAEETADSDLDVFLVVEDEAQAEAASEASFSLAEGVTKEFGLRLSPVVFTRTEFVRGHRRGRRLFRNAARDAMPICGPTLLEVATWAGERARESIENEPAASRRRRASSSTRPTSRGQKGSGTRRHFSSSTRRSPTQTR